MTSSILKTVIPAAALLAGLMTATFLGAQRSKPDMVANADVADRFEQLSASKQEQLLSWAESFRELKQDPIELERLQLLHSEVKDDSELAEKLERFHEWWSHLDAVGRQRIRPDGIFGDNWVSQVQLVYTDSDIRNHQIPVRLPTGSWRGSSQMGTFTETDYENFLREALPSPLPSALKEKFALYDEGCDQNLFKTIWLLRELRKQQFSGGRPNPNAASLVSVPDVKQASIDHLTPDKSAENSATYSLREVMPFLGAAFDHYSEQFRGKHLASTENELVSFYDDLDPEVQLELMKYDPAESRKELRNLLIRKLKSEDPAIAELAESMFGLKKRVFDDMRRRLDSFRRPGGKGRGGTRGGFGRNRPDEGGSAQNEPRDGRNERREPGGRPEGPRPQSQSFDDSRGQRRPEDR